MDKPRGWPVVARSAVVAGLGLCAALAAARPAAAQFDMDPYRPYNGQYRTSNFPAELGSSGDAVLGPATTSAVPGVARGYRNDVIGDRIGADLDRDLFGEDDDSARGGARRYTPATRNPADRQVAQDRSLRDRYYLEAQREPNPKRRAELMELYRKEDRRLTRSLSARSQSAPTRDPEPAVLPRREGPAPAPARTPASPAPARREAAPRAPAARPRTEGRRAPASGTTPAPAAGAATTAAPSTR